MIPNSADAELVGFASCLWEVRATADPRKELTESELVPGVCVGHPGESPPWLVSDELWSWVESRYCRSDLVAICRADRR